MKVLTPFSMSAAIWGVSISALAGTASASNTACCPSGSVTAFCTFPLLNIRIKALWNRRDHRTDTIEELL